MAGFSIAHRYAGACSEGKRPLADSPRARAAGRARPGWGRPHLRPRNKAPARAGRGERGRGPLPSTPFCFPPPGPLTARSGPRWALALRPPPPCSRRTEGSRPTGPPAALDRPHPGASLKRPRSPRAPRVQGARRIPYIATAPAKNSAARARAGAGGLCSARRSCRHPRLQKPRLA